MPEVSSTDSSKPPAGACEEHEPCHTDHGTGVQAVKNTVDKLVDHLEWLRGELEEHRANTRIALQRSSDEEWATKPVQHHEFKVTPKTVAREVLSRWREKVGE